MHASGMGAPHHHHQGPY